ncbi:hypothetical protein [Acidianus bottle-shaped virus 2 strain ABV2]|uniref:Uncharacterized protein n=1 Tax=Acidianus bottle-shaped virus 2 strain ABV2 TaxID=1732173 RepID=A0A0N9P964_9VIRU|nr:hypothetical protein AVU01_gp42 [Acidianus bottle-shaped virus 2 strain ABV2]ALG96790.1 hypothetical protein [Acidianus bottle-shaped virus 2 strain ABV2]
MSEIVEEIQEFFQKYNGFCGLLPPSVDSSITSFLANLPFVLLFLITTPIRFFICIFSSITSINITCAVINLFAPASIIIPFITAQSPPVCSTQCQYCSAQTGECANYNSEIASYFTNCQNQFSILNKVFCLIGVTIADILNPIIAFINPLIYLAIHKVICLNTNPSICGI